MILQNPPLRYDQSYQTRLNTTLKTADDLNRKRGTDIELVQERLILRSPNGTRYKVTVSDAGVLSAVPM